MEINPIVTIRCITYNHEPYIRECLEGFVMQQTNFKFEAIVHDDASTDGTAAIIAEYAEKYPDIIKPLYETENQYSKKDGSLDRIMNSHMRGKYIAICEGDDYWTDPLKLKKQVDILERKESIVAVVTNSSICDQFSVEIRSERRVVLDNIEGAYNLHSFFKNNHLYPTLTVVYKNCFSDKVNRDTEIMRNGVLGDWILWIALHKRGDFYFLPDVTGAYRINPTSVTHSDWGIERWNADFEIRRNVMLVLPHEYHNYVKNDWYAYYMLGHIYRKHSDILKMLYNYFCSFYSHPLNFIREVVNAISYTFFKNRG